MNTRVLLLLVAPCCLLNIGDGLHCGECLNDGVGLSEVRSTSDNVINDSDVVDAVGDNMAAVLGMIVSVHGRVAKRPLKQGWFFQASVELVCFLEFAV